MSILYVVATPIGNLDDIGIRAKRILSEVDTVLAEDTRQSKILLTHIGATPKNLIAYHDFNKEKITPRLIDSLKSGIDMAIICDAGTPGIADEAFYLVRQAIRENIRVVPIPGACAFITALIASGLPTDRFIFENFLPVKSARRIRFFESIKNEPRTVIFYESPYRIVKVLEEMKTTLGDVSMAIGREISKIHEEFLRGTPQALLAHFLKTKPRGEFVLLVNTRISPEQYAMGETVDSNSESDENNEV